jgi:tetratricopeptide (TPR) repeat protein
VLKNLLKGRRYDKLLDQLTAKLERGDWEAALQDAHEAVRHAEDLHGTRHVELVTPLYALACAKLAAGRVEDAFDATERAVTMATRRSVPSRSVLVELGLNISVQLHNLAASLEEADSEAAVRLYKRALTVTDTRPTLVRLARLHHAARRFGEAAELYGRALTMAKADSAPDEVTKALEIWMGDANGEIFR